MTKQFGYDDQSFPRYFPEIASRYRDRRFVRVGDCEYTYGRFYDEMVDVAQRLRALGIDRGERVPIMLGNSIEFLQSWLALAYVGAIEVPLNTAYGPFQLEYVLNDVQATVCITEASFLPMLEEVRPKLEFLKTIIVVDTAEGAAPKSGYRIVDFGRVAASSARNGTSTVEPREHMAILYTSGTTGPPKGVMLCHRHEYTLGKNCAEQLGLTSGSVYYNFFPMFHNTAQAMITLAVILTGASMVLRERFSASRFWQDVRSENITHFYYSGPILKILLSAPPGPSDKEHRVELAMGLSSNAELQKEFEDRFGVPTAELYGSTEANVPVFTGKDNPFPGSAGMALPEWSVRVVDPLDQFVPVNQVGEIVVRPEQPDLIFSGYFNSPQKTLEACRNLWFHTGDAGYLNSDGYLFFVDRIKDVIRRRGENISSYEIESVLSMHPAVLECAAVAVPAELGEDEIKLVVVLKPGATVTPEMLLTFCGKHLAYYAVPRYVEFRDELPKTETNKIEKYRMRQEGVHKGVWDREKAGFTVRRRR